MDISMNTSSAIAQNVNGAVGVAVLKKALTAEAQGAMQLIDAVSSPQSSLPPHLGQNVNTTA